MIKKGTVGHEVLMTIINNPMTIEALSNELDVEMANIRASVRYMTTKKGVNLHRKGSLIWIDEQDLPEFGMFSHDRVYIHLVENGSITSREVRDICNNHYQSKDIKQLMERVESDYGVKLERSLADNNGKRRLLRWSLSCK